MACINPTHTAPIVLDLVLSFHYMLWRRKVTDIQQPIPGIWTSSSHPLVFLFGVEEAVCVLHKSMSATYYTVLHCDHEN